MNTPKTLIEAVTYYSDEQLCRDVMVQVKWPDGKIVCPVCGCDKCKPMPTRPNYLRCSEAGCRKQFSHKVGTIFEDSPLSLSVWFVAVWCIANAKNGISSHELARAVGVTQKTAWFMLHRIRTAMENGTFQKLSGTCETDETYIGGTYTAVAPFHLDRYVAEQVFRFNLRKTTDAGRFAQVMLQVVGKRITYRTLTAKDDAGFMGIR